MAAAKESTPAQGEEEEGVHLLRRTGGSPRLKVKKAAQKERLETQILAQNQMYYARTTAAQKERRLAKNRYARMTAAQKERRNAKNRLHYARMSAAQKERLMATQKLYYARMPAAQKERYKVNRNAHSKLHRAR